MCSLAFSLIHSLTGSVTMIRYRLECAGDEFVAATYHVMPLMLVMLLKLLNF
jgi:hypothetical protein